MSTFKLAERLKPNRSWLPGEGDRPASGRPLRRALWLLALGLLVGLGWWWRDARPKDSTRPSVAVLSFEESSEQSASAWLSTALSEMLIGQLAAGGALRLIPGGTVARTQQELALDSTSELSRERLAQIGRMLNSDFVVYGSYRVVQRANDRQLRIDLRLNDTQRDASPRPIAKTGTEARLFDLVSEVAAELRQILNVKQLSAAQQRSWQTTLPSRPEVLRLYLEGLDKLRSFDPFAARESLEQAVALDPSYALAHTVLSQTLSTLGYDREAEESGRRAIELAQGLAEEDNLRIQGRYFEAAGQWTRAIRTYQSLWRLFPDSVEYGLRLTNAQIMAGRGQEALSTVALLRAFPAPANSDPRIDLAEAHAAHSLADYRRQMEAAKRGARKGVELGASILVAEARFWQGKASFPLLEMDEATAAFQEARDLFTAAGDQGRVAQVLSRIADVLSFRNMPEALDVHRQALTIHRQNGNRKGVSQALNSMAFLFYQRGDLASARVRLEEAVAIGREIGDRYSEANYLDTLIDVLLRQGDLQAARELALRERAIYRDLGNREGLAWSYFYLGRIALAAGDVPGARSWYDQALVISAEISNPYLTAYLLDELAKSLLAGGDFSGAMRMSSDARRIRSELAGRSTLAQSQVTAARILLEKGRPTEAEDLALEAVAVFQDSGKLDEAAAAGAVLARALSAQAKGADAELRIDAASKHARNSQNPTVRLSVVMTAAELLAAVGKSGQSVKMLEAVVTEAHGLGLIQLELEARLTWGKIEIGGGRGSQTAALASGRQRLEVLAKRARELGYGLVARKAGAALAALAGPGPASPSIRIRDQR